MQANEPLIKALERQRNVMANDAAMAAADVAMLKAELETQKQANAKLIEEIAAAKAAMKRPEHSEPEGM